jgi:hypothetical protein
MATITLSKGYTTYIMNSISVGTTTINTGYVNNSYSNYGIDSANSLASMLNADTSVTPSYGSIIHYWGSVGAYGNNNPGVTGLQPSAINFKNSSGTTLTSYTISELTRTIDADGYLVLSNFPPRTPVTAGTISQISIDNGNRRTITLTVGAPNGSSDVQFSDRDLVTTQPWRLDGTIKFRIPTSYTWSA